MNSKKFILKTPVLFLVFNRLDTTKRVFEEIRKAKPTKLFVAADGPRNDEEKRKTESVRKYILNNIDWKCEVKTLFREKNLGCKYAVSGAIDWFFENVEQGIILEDDCLPSQSFFRFCQEMLEKYKNDERIMSISGFNPLGKFDIKKSYLFSKYFFCWGWATWRRGWEKMDLELQHYKNASKKKIREILSSFFERFLYKRRFNQNIKGKINSWAISFFYSHLFYKKLSIIPKVNLIENLGFSNLSSTHVKESYWDKKYLYHKTKSINFPLKHPIKIKSKRTFDKSFIIQEIKRIFSKNLNKFI